MPTQSKGNSKLIDAYVRRLIKHIDRLESGIVKLASFVFLIAAVEKLHYLKFTGSDETKFRELIPVALIGIGGIVVLSLTILIFVYFLREKPNKVSGLEVKVVRAFMKALDESPLESHAVDKEYHESA